MIRMVTGIAVDGRPVRTAGINVAKKRLRDFRVGQIVQSKRSGMVGQIISEHAPERAEEVKYMIRMQDGCNWLMPASSIQEVTDAPDKGRAKRHS